MNFKKYKNEQANEQMIINNKDGGETNNQDETKELNYEVEYKWNIINKNSMKTPLKMIRNKHGNKWTKNMVHEHIKQIIERQINTRKTQRQRWLNTHRKTKLISYILWNTRI